LNIGYDKKDYAEDGKEAVEMAKSKKCKKCGQGY